MLFAILKLPTHLPLQLPSKLRQAAFQRFSPRLCILEPSRSARLGGLCCLLLRCRLGAASLLRKATRRATAAGVRQPSKVARYRPSQSAGTALPTVQDPLLQRISTGDHHSHSAEAYAPSPRRTRLTPTRPSSVTAHLQQAVIVLPLRRQLRCMLLPDRGQLADGGGALAGC